MDKEDSLEEAALSRGYNDRVAGEGTEEKSLPGQGNSKHRELGTKKKKLSLLYLSRGIAP